MFYLISTVAHRGHGTYIFISRDNFQFNKIQPSFYHEYCIQDGNLFPRFSLLLLTLLLSVFTTRALLPMFLEEPWVLTVNRQIRFQNGYVWTWKLLNLEIDSCGLILYPDTWGGGGGGVGA